jgi:hypothetical protein
MKNESMNVSFEYEKNEEFEVTKDDILFHIWGN